MRIRFIVSLALALSALAGSTALAQTSTSHHSSSYTINTQSRKYSFALVTRGGDSISSWGNWESSSFDNLSHRSKTDTLYVKKGDELYAITDANVIRKAKEALEPMERLGKQQGELGRKQGELGRQQGQLGRQQGEYGRSMGEAARGMAPDSDSHKKYSDRMKQLGEQMRRLGEQQKALGEQQKALGAQQSDLGKKQSQAAKEADAKITDLIDDAFARGLAKKV